MNAGHRNVDTDGWNVVGQRRRVIVSVILDHEMSFVVCRWQSYERRGNSTMSGKQCFLVACREGSKFECLLNEFSSSIDLVQT